MNSLGMAIRADHLRAPVSFKPAIPAERGAIRPTRTCGGPIRTSLHSNLCGVSVESKRFQFLACRRTLDAQPNKFLSVKCAADGQDKGGFVDMSGVSAKEDSALLSPEWPAVGLALFGLGVLLGPLLDGIHSRVQLQIYDNGAINVFGLQTNIWVPPLLGVFYSVAGLLQLILDKKFAPKGSVPTASLTKVATSLLTLAVLLELSAEMYAASVPYNIEGYVLFFCAEVNWLLLENTWWGFGLACLVGVACPLAELPILKLFGLWHYPKSNVVLFDEGFISWVICCYFFYTPFIANLARWLSSYPKQSVKQKV